MAKEKTLKVFVADDGTEHETEKQANQQDAENAFVGWYDNNNQDVDLWGATGQSRVDSLDLLCWLKMNKNKVLSLYENIE